MRSSGLGQGFFAGLFPVEWGPLIEVVLIGHRGEAFQQVFEIAVRLHAVHPAVLDERKNDRVAMARVF